MQGPEHNALPKPVVLPNRPAGHWMHDDCSGSGLYWPMLQFVHADALPVLNCPGGHWFSAGDAVPSGQKKPAGQEPSHVDTVRPGVPPKRPAGQAAVQLGDVIRMVLP